MNFLFWNQSIAKCTLLGWLISAILYLGDTRLCILISGIYFIGYYLAMVLLYNYLRNWPLATWLTDTAWMWLMLQQYVISDSIYLSISIRYQHVNASPLCPECQYFAVNNGFVTPLCPQGVYINSVNTMLSPLWTLYSHQALVLAPAFSVPNWNSFWEVFLYTCHMHYMNGVLT